MEDETDCESGDRPGDPAYPGLFVGVLRVGESGLWSDAN